jgi:hypothetical protein
MAYVVTVGTEAWSLTLLRSRGALTNCMTAVMTKKLSNDDVLATLAELFVERSLPVHIHSEQAPEIVANAVKAWLGRLGVKTLDAQDWLPQVEQPPGGPW